MLTKEKLFDALKNLPEKFTLDDVLDRIVLLNKIESGLEQSINNVTLSTEEAKTKLGKWLK